LRFRYIRFGQHQRDLARNATDIGLVPPFLGCFRRGHRFAKAAPGVVELVELRMGLG
jgi:hypothetical protein